MPTELKDGLPILFETITYNLRHQDYAHVIQIAEDYTTYATGLNIEKKLRQFNGRESDEEFTQRLVITKFNTPDIFASCIKPLYKVGRTPAAIQVYWDGKDAAKAAELKKELYDSGKNFWGKKDVTKYITQRAADLEATDPNSFVIVEFAGEVDPTKPDTKAKPYPFEANSAEAINFKYENNDLQWLIVLNAISMKDGKGKVMAAEKYFMYLDNEAITATQVHRDSIDALKQNGAVEIVEGIDLGSLKPKTVYIFNNGDKSEKNRKYFVLNVFEHKVGFVPAKRFGCTYDMTTRNRTCIPLIFAAQSYFEKSIQVMSEFDMTNRCHVWPKVFQYADPCPGEKKESGWVGCDKGYRPDGKTICGACHGSGLKLHTSSQSVIQIRMPNDRNISELASLENMMAIKSPPMDLITFQKEYGFEDMRRYACRAVYNSDVFSQEQIQTTATSKVIDLDAVYDTLTSYADSWSEMYCFIYKCIAQLRDIDQGFKIVHEFPKDFKMQSVSQLLDDLSKATKSGAPSHIIKSIVRDISNKMYADQPQKVLVLDTKDKYYPFPGKSEQEINYIIANGLTTVYNKIFYAHFDLVFAEIEYEQSTKELDFYQMVEATQRELIEAKVQEFIDEVEEDDAAAAALAFKNAPDTGSEPPVKEPAVVE